MVRSFHLGPRPGLRPSYDANSSMGLADAALRRSLEAFAKTLPLSERCALAEMRVIQNGWPGAPLTTGGCAPGQRAREEKRRSEESARAKLRAFCASEGFSTTRLLSLPQVCLEPLSDSERAANRAAGGFRARTLAREVLAVPVFSEAVRCFLASGVGGGYDDDEVSGDGNCPANAAAPSTGEKRPSDNTVAWKSAFAGVICCLPIWLVLLGATDTIKTTAAAATTTVAATTATGQLPLSAYPWGVGAALAVTLNSLVRLALPSSYVPATQCRPGFLASPVCARILALAAEFAYYHAEARALGLPFLAPPRVGALGLLTVLGETLCCAHVYTQSELLGFVEDSTWTVLQLWAVLFSPSPLKWVVSAPFVFHMSVFHLPRMSRRLERPFIRKWATPKILAQDSDTVNWVVPSLLAKPVTYALFLQACLVSGTAGTIPGGGSSSSSEFILYTTILPALVAVLVSGLILAAARGPAAAAAAAAS